MGGESADALTSRSAASTPPCLSKQNKNEIKKVSGKKPELFLLY
jgi:hypothetical protein